MCTDLAIGSQRREESQWALNNNKKVYFCFYVTDINVLYVQSVSEMETKSKSAKKCHSGMKYKIQIK